MRFGDDREAVTSRRSFIGAALYLLLFEPVHAEPTAQTSFKGKVTFERIVAKSAKNNWRSLPIGELAATIGKELQGVPYQGQTLELSRDAEICCANFVGLDCVTFVETTLAFARMLKKGKSTPDDLLGEIACIRYRNGVVGDYTSRLHYTSDWFKDNESKGVLQLLPDLSGSEAFVPKVNFMSTHPSAYKQLAAHPALVQKIAEQEKRVSNYKLHFVPLDKIAQAEPELRTGDIVGVTTNIPGLDVVHMGLVLRTADGVAHFMDASSVKQQMKVRIEPGPLHNALHWSKSLTGAIFARPLEP